MLAVAATALTTAGFAAELRLDPGPYPYVVIDQDIKGVLVEFGRNVGLPVDVSDQVRGRMRGHHTSGSAREFLDGLCDSYGLVWYFDGKVLHVNVKSEVRTDLVDLGKVPLAEAVNELAALGVSDSRFAVERSDDDGSMVSISGPPAFLSYARQTLTTLARRPRETEDEDVNIHIFRGGTTPLVAPAPAVQPSRGKSKG